MILIALGSNLPSRWGSPSQTLDMALASFGQLGVGVIKRSQWYRTRAVNTRGQPGFLDQPEFVNGVIRVETIMMAEVLHRRLRALEARFGHTRAKGLGSKVAPRTLDLDLIDYHGQIRGAGGTPPIRGPKRGGDLVLPHPGARHRAFVLVPLREVAPRWRHPVSGETVDRLIERLPLEARAAVRPLGPETAGCGHD